MFKSWSDWCASEEFQRQSTGNQRQNTKRDVSHGVCKSMQGAKGFCGQNPKVRGPRSKVHCIPDTKGLAVGPENWAVSAGEWKRLNYSKVQPLINGMATRGKGTLFAVHRVCVPFRDVWSPAGQGRIVLTGWMDSGYLVSDRVAHTLGLQNRPVRARPAETIIESAPCLSQ